MKRHHKILRRAKRSKLPDRLEGDDAAAVIELIDLGYMSGIKTTTLEGPSVMDPAITLPGAQYLKEQEKITKWASGALGGVIVAILTAAALKLFGLV